MVTTKIFYEYRTRAGCHESAMLARFGWTFERFRSPLHFWYVVLKLRSVWICVSLGAGVDTSWNGAHQPVGVDGLQVTCWVESCRLGLQLGFDENAVRGVHMRSMKDSL